MVFDDYGSNDFPGAKKAVDEFLSTLRSILLMAEPVKILLIVFSNLPKMGEEEKILKMVVAMSKSFLSSSSML